MKMTDQQKRDRDAQIDALILQGRNNYEIVNLVHCSMTTVTKRRKVLASNEYSNEYQISNTDKINQYPSDVETIKNEERVDEDVDWLPDGDSEKSELHGAYFTLDAANEEILSLNCEINELQDLIVDLTNDNVRLADVVRHYQKGLGVSIIDLEKLLHYPPKAIRSQIKALMGRMWMAND